MVDLNFPYPDFNNGLFGFVAFMQYVNILCNGWLGAGMLVIIGFVAFFTTKDYTVDRALGYASTITLISAIFLRFINLIDDGKLLLVIVIFIGSLIYLIRQRNVEMGV